MLILSLNNLYDKHNNDNFYFKVVGGGSGRMKFNRAEMAALASQPTHRYTLAIHLAVSLQIA